MSGFHSREAVRLLAESRRVIGDSNPGVRRALAEAQIAATLAVVDRLGEVVQAVTALAVMVGPLTEPSADPAERDRGAES